MMLLMLLCFPTVPLSLGSSDVNISTSFQDTLSVTISFAVSTSDVTVKASCTCIMVFSVAEI